MSDNIKHYGTPRRSGRYPWGSGDDPYQRSMSFLGMVKDLSDNGMNEKEIAEAFGITTTALRARKSIANDERKKAEIDRARKLREKGNSYEAIAQIMGKPNESSIRALLKPGLEDRANKTVETANLLKDAVDKKGSLDIGIGTEFAAGVSRTKLKTAVMLLEEEGYKVYELKTNQVGTGKKTTILTLSPPGTEFMDVVKNRHEIGVLGEVTVDSEGRTKLGLGPINSIKSKNVMVRYKEDGGEDKDGLIELRRGVPELDMGNSKYAQVRIAVDDTHFLKGMAVYNDKMPDGVNVIYNTNKKKGVPAKDVFKEMKRKVTGWEEVDGQKKPIYGEIDWDNPFGAQVKQFQYKDKNGKEKQSALNIVNEQGDWRDWSRNLASQFLSKQKPTLIQKQLDLDLKIKKDEYDEIMSITNPTVRKKLLESYAEGLDADAAHLKAAALPRQGTHVILPFPGMKDTEVYAPNYRDGEDVVLVRYPHGGVFEIPELKVNNRFAAAKKLLGQAEDAIGMSPKVAQQLSGADFDGDTVIVIPNRSNGVSIKTSRPLKDLQDFDPKIYKNPKLPEMKSATKENEMGKVSNLITDMTLKGAPESDIARAVRHSMVVIDAQKHGLDYKQSYKDNRIGELKKTYQGGEKKGASTIISRASAEIRVPHRKEGQYVTDPKTGKTRRLYVDPKTGKKLYTETGESFINKAGKLIKRQSTSKQMYEVDDAYKLSSGTPQESMYADYANKLKGLANQSRKEALETPSLKYSPSAKTTYKKEVDTLNAKLNTALKNKPLERKAQLVANKIVALKKEDNPLMDNETLKKVKGQALNEARNRVGANKTKVEITSREWEAIQAGAISNNKLRQILDNSDEKTVKTLATPRTKSGLSTGRTNLAKAMLRKGYTQRDIADHLGVSVDLINDIDV